MPRRSNTGYQSLEGESVRDVGDTSSAHDGGVTTSGTVTSNPTVLVSEAETAYRHAGGAGGAGVRISNDSVIGSLSQPPTEFDTDNEASFSSRDQTRRLLRKQFLRWLGTAFFVTMIFVTFKIYQSKGIITPTQKATYNAIITGLSLGLGLNFFEAFKDFAKVLRWWILSRKAHNAREVDLILDIENVFTVFRLGYEFLANRQRLLLCTAWILIILLAQVSIALINLTATINDGTDYNGTYTKPGTVLAANLTCYFRGHTCDSRPPANVAEVKPRGELIKQAMAHIYGELARSSPCGPYSTISDILSNKDNSEYFCRRTPSQQEFAYRFLEYNPSDKQRQYPFLTQRVITASAGPCFQYSKVNATLTRDAGGHLAAWLYWFKNDNDTFYGNITIPVQNEAIGGTTYAYQGFQVPQLANVVGCGPRCMWMWAHRSFGQGHDAKDNDTFFHCKVTINNVMNATLDEHNVPDGMARLAASAIGLQGRWSGDKNHPNWKQYQFYPEGTAWETHHHSLDEVGANMAEFAIGSLSILASRAPLIQIPGTVPYLGSLLMVFWPYATALLVAIAGAHVGISLSVIWLTRHIIVKDDSNLATARLLRPLVERLGASGTLLEGAAIGRAVGANRGLVYGPRVGEAGGGHYLDLSTDVSPRRRNERHPDGMYR